MNVTLNHQQRILADVLSGLDYPLLAEEALKETNIEILKGYARIAELRARKLDENHAFLKKHTLNLMSIYGLISN